MVFASPLPLATRCVALGRYGAPFYRCVGRQRRIALIASGASLWTSWSAARLGRYEWAEHFELLVRGNIRRWRPCYRERINHAGNNSGRVVELDHVAAPSARPNLCFSKATRQRLCGWKFD